MTEESMDGLHGQLANVGPPRNLVQLKACSTVNFFCRCNGKVDEEVAIHTTILMVSLKAPLCRVKSHSDNSKTATPVWCYLLIQCPWPGVSWLKNYLVDWLLHQCALASTGPWSCSWFWFVYSQHLIDIPSLVERWGPLTGRDTFQTSEVVISGLCWIGTPRPSSSVGGRRSLSRSMDLVLLVRVGSWWWYILKRLQQVSKAKSKGSLCCMWLASYNGCKLLHFLNPFLYLLWYVLISEGLSTQGRS